MDRVTVTDSGLCDKRSLRSVSDMKRYVPGHRMKLPREIDATRRVSAQHIGDSRTPARRTWWIRIRMSA
jgi:hypothetical protein